MAKKRILSILLCFIIAVPLIAVPAFATGTGTGTAMYPVLNWNMLGVGTNYQNQTEFAGRFLRSGNSDVSTTSALMSQIWSAGQSYTRATAEIYTGAGNRSLNFIGRDFVLDLAKLTVLEIRATQDEYDCDVGVSGQIGVMSLVGNYWRIVEFPLNFRSRSSSLLSDFKEAIANITTNNLVYVRSLQFQCTTNVDEADGVWFYTSSFTNSPQALPNFLGQQPMKYQNIVQVDPANPNDVSFVDWLVVGVGGFLQFELWEGFTLNQLIEFVVVIGLVLWFITLLI